MKHLSVPISNCEFLNIEKINPLISKCQIKVCYIGDTPNRNRSVITKEAAREIAQSLPGSPIVGTFSKETGDYEEHNKLLSVDDNGNYTLTSDTQPYGFVDINARVWFQKFLDDNEFEREYLVTEGYLWTGQYPESQRIIDKGNNQSMELDEKTLNAKWAKNKNDNKRFFIINEAIISKLCILGEEYEPCFEGATITKTQFSLGQDFSDKFSSLVNNFQKLINEGGEKDMLDNENQPMIEEEQDTAPSTEYSSETDNQSENLDENTEFKKKSDEEEKNEENQDKEEKTDSSNSDNSTEDKEEDSKEDNSDEEEDKKKKKNYSLEEIPEYVELQNKYAQLTTEFSALEEKNASLNEQLASLTSFKNQVEKQQKQDMIDSFYMLNDEDKKDVIDNIDTYSLNDIEAKLSVICVRNKLDLSSHDEDVEESNPTSYNLGDNIFNNDTVPPWVRAVLDTEKKLNN